VDPHGVLIVDKPSGPTSHDVVDVVRRVLHTRRVGHTGTLDPFASGVLPLCVGKATRLARFLSGHDKTYEATVRLGFATATDDLEGEALGAPRPVGVDLAGVRAAAQTFLGPIEQLPPAFSAKRTAGRRHHELARKGQAVERTPCRVIVHSIDVSAVEGDRVAMVVACSAGTYVRALARDLGERLGVGGHLVALRRTRSGPFTLGDGIALAGLDPVQAEARLVPPGQLLPELPAVVVGERGLAALRHGRALDRAMVVRGFPETVVERVRVLDEAGALAALAVPRGFGKSTSGLNVEPMLHPDIVLLD
jgi:tRNA pseudouridine55 synthase